MSNVFEKCPLPWVTDTMTSVFDANGQQVIEDVLVSHVDTTYSDDVQVAAEIVKRVNAHDSLVAGLKRIAGNDGACFCGDGVDECYPCMARTALSKAVGEAQ